MGDKEIAEFFQRFRKELGFVKTFEVQSEDTAAVVVNSEVIAAARYRHCVQRSHTSLYDIAVDPQYQRTGIGSALVAAIAEESHNEKLRAKCPAELPANDFYRETGWNLVETVDGKKTELNIYEKYIN